MTVRLRDRIKSIILWRATLIIQPLGWPRSGLKLLAFSQMFKKMS